MRFRKDEYVGKEKCTKIKNKKESVQNYTQYFPLISVCLGISGFVFFTTNGRIEATAIPLYLLFIS